MTISLSKPALALAGTIFLASSLVVPVSAQATDGTLSIVNNTQAHLGLCQGTDAFSPEIVNPGETLEIDLGEGNYTDLSFGSIVNGIIDCSLIGQYDEVFEVDVAAGETTLVKVDSFGGDQFVKVANPDYGGRVTVQADPDSIVGDPISIVVNDDFSYQVTYDGRQQFFGDNAASTFLVVDGQSYGPFVPAGELHDNPYTLVSQDSGGAGTEADPFWQETVVTAGDIQLTQRIEYVNGDQVYDLTFDVQNLSTTTDHSVQVIHAADLYLNFPDNAVLDDGYGWFWDEHDIIGCSTGENGQGQLQGFISRTDGSTYVEDHFAFVWDTIGNQDDLSNDFRGTYHDCGAALEWGPATIPAEGDWTIEMTGVFGLEVEAQEEENLTRTGVNTTTLSLIGLTAILASGAYLGRRAWMKQ